MATFASRLPDVVSPIGADRPAHVLRTAWPLLVAAALAGCGGGSGGGAGPDAGGPTAVSDTAVVLPVVTGTPVPTEPPIEPPVVVPPVPEPVPVTTAFNGGHADPGLLMLLVPDGQAEADPRVTSWADAASEVGTRMAMVTDAQFLALGTAGARQYAGLVLPDQLHSVASDALVAAVRDYTTQGGKTLLTYDFGALTLDGNRQPVYPIPKSRLSDLAGVDYVLYDALRERTVGLGPVTAMRSTMRQLLVPPGKSLPYVATPAAGTGVVAAAQLTSGQALFLAASPADPGAVTAFDPAQLQNLPLMSASARQLAGTGVVAPRTVKVKFGKAFKAARVARVTAATASGTAADPVGVIATADAAAVAPPATVATVTTADTLDAYHGYVLGNLVYPSYVTTGAFAGTTVATSPDFGLVAGVQRVGAGQVLFVNLPLTYLKGRTDALPMHGFLNYFMQQVVRGTRLSTMPNAVAGMTFDWHLDSMGAQKPSLALEAAGVFRKGPFSMEMTAGPDTIVPGDGLGWNLNNNPVAQQLLRRLDAGGHAIGSHGGWAHDHYGNNATEANKADYLPLLLQNRAAVDGVLGKAARSYSAPQGNNPTWAMDWLEQQGVVGAYFGGHTGLGATRQYRDGVLRNPALTVFPVTPQGLYATFEEFQEYKVPKQDVIDWYRGMVDFSLDQNTSRMVYAHPPGANAWRSVLNNLLSYADAKGGRFRWYTMPRLADFMATRDRAVWRETMLPGGATQFDVSHPASLAEMVWMLPKDRYLKPTLPSGGASVVNGGSAWLVKAAAVKQLRFQALPNPVFVPA